jgi:hypothetical protein
MDTGSGAPIPSAELILWALRRYMEAARPALAHHRRDRHRWRDRSPRLPTVPRRRPRLRDHLMAGLPTRVAAIAVSRQSDRLVESPPAVAAEFPAAAVAVAAGPPPVVDMRAVAAAPVADTDKFVQRNEKGWRG